MESGDALVSSAGGTRGLLSPSKNEYHRKHSRSLSVPRSEKSIVSHNTLVEENAEFVANNQVDPDENENDNSNDNPHCEQKPKKSLLNLLKSIFCMRGSQKMDERGRIDSGLTEHMPSPWIQHVYVLAARNDTENHPVPKMGLCTIDTGNMQGNLVSREFVKRLGYSELNIRGLKEDEKRGAVGITNDKLIPEGAIYLTWYHKRGTRIFHNMRFLISPHPHADLVIGAQSILKYDLLTAPNFMVGSAPNGGGITVLEGESGDPELAERRSAVVGLEEKINEVEADIKVEKKRKQPRQNKIDSKEKELQEYKKDHKLAEKLHLIRKAQIEDPPNKELLKKLREELEQLDGYQPEVHGVSAGDKEEEEKKTTVKDKNV